ncbi:hypothetical protein ACXNSR_30790 [Streptomyces sp. NC-S4]
MADLYALDLAFDLLDTTPDDVLAEVRRQLTSPDGLLSAQARRGGSAACSSARSHRRTAAAGR